jgi:hypothetical protein
VAFREVAGGTAISPWSRSALIDDRGGSARRRHGTPVVRARDRRRQDAVETRHGTRNSRGLRPAELRRDILRNCAPLIAEAQQCAA